MSHSDKGEFGFDEDWLGRHVEPILEPALPIIDPHHHLWDRDRGARYLFDEVLRDVGSGHNIRATVFAQCYAMFRAGAEPAWAPLGETEFVNGIAAISASGLYGPARICAGIVGYADLRLGDRVAAVLEAHLARAPDRFKGIRFITEWDEDPTIRTAPERFQPGLMADATFRAGFARLAPLGLSYDAWLFHPQIPELAELARAFPETSIVLDHIGAPLRVGRYADRQAEVLADWRRSMAGLATCPNVRVKVGGLDMRVFNFANDRLPTPPSSEMLAEEWRPYVETCVELFGASRCMFQSNFPVDKAGCSYPVLWNAFKRLASGCSPDEKAALFHDTAATTYRL